MEKTKAQLEKEIKDLKKEITIIQESRMTYIEQTRHYEGEAKKAASQVSLLMNELRVEKEKMDQIKIEFGDFEIKKGRPKQIEIDILAICADNEVKCPQSMTISEAKKVEFCLRNLFQEAKAFGQ